MSKGLAAPKSIAPVISYSARLTIDYRFQQLNKHLDQIISGLPQCPYHHTRSLLAATQNRKLSQ